MDYWGTPLAVAGVTAAASVVVALVSLAARDRWPQDLREAQRLSALIDKMPDTEQRQLASDYRDDLVTGWILLRLSPFRRLQSFGLALEGLMGTLSVTFAAFVLFIPSWVTDHGEQVGPAFAVVAALGALGIVLDGFAISRQRTLESWKMTRDLRESVADEVARASRSERREQRDQTKVARATKGEDRRAHQQRLDHSDKPDRARRHD